MKRRETLIPLLALLALVFSSTLAGCADNRTPAERLMSYVEKSGGTGSAESSVSASLPVVDGDTSCVLSLSKDKLTLEFTAPDSDHTSALKHDAITTVEIDLSDDSGKFLHEQSLSIASTSLESTSSGTFNAKTLTKSSSPNVTNVLVNNSGGSIKGTATDGLKKNVVAGIDGALTCFSAYLEKSNLKLTLADFGLEAY